MFQAHALKTAMKETDRKKGPPLYGGHILNCISLLCVSVCEGVVCGYQGKHVEVRGQLSGGSSLF